MTNYKVKLQASTIPYTTPLFEEIPLKEIVSSATADTFGSWVQLSADIGINKALYSFLAYHALNQAGVEGTIFEIGEGASSSEVAVLRVKYSLHGSGEILPIHNVYLPLTDNARISARVKDGEAQANTTDFVINVGAKIT